MSKILYAAGTMAHINAFHLDHINALRAEGHEVFVMAKGEGADYNIAFEKKMFSLKNLACQREIKRIIKEQKFDRIILNTTLAAFNVRFVLPRRNRPFTVHIVHGFMFTEKCPTLKEKIFRLAERLVANKTDALLVMNEEDRRITERHRLTKGDVFVTRGMGAKLKEQAVPPEKIREELSAEGKYLITFVGELCYAKGQHTLIELLPRIKEKIPNAALLFVGDGAGYEELLSLAKDRGVESDVIFTGRRENAQDYVRAADLYIAPSFKEGLPFNVIEAQGLGKTVIATDIKGQRDLIKDGESGYLYPLGDSERLLEQICRVYSGEAALEKEKIYEAYKAYSFDGVFPETYKIISDLAK